ncbi:hypothetical protein TNCV_1003821 [Trichonephila clavipes]|nr:hypothetical protein TNCV_1003821 [Trichonephila clavipes]
MGGTVVVEWSWSQTSGWSRQVTSSNNSASGDRVKGLMHVKYVKAPSHPPALCGSLERRWYPNKVVCTPSHDKTSPIFSVVQKPVRHVVLRKFAGVEVKVLMREAG